MVEQIEDGKIDTLERLSNIWQKVTRGDIAVALRQDQGHLPRRRQGHQGADRARAHHPRGLPRLPRRAEGGRGDGAGGAEDAPRASWTRPSAEMDAASKTVEAATTTDAGRARAARARPRRDAARAAGRGAALPDRQGPQRQPDRRLQHLRSDHGAADADHQRQGARLSAVGHLLLHQRVGADGAQRLVHRPARPAREHPDAEHDEGGRSTRAWRRSPRSAARCRRRR